MVNDSDARVVLTGALAVLVAWREDSVSTAEYIRECLANSATFPKDYPAVIYEMHARNFEDLISYIVEELDEAPLTVREVGN
jgi:hypothetical protein